MPRRFAAGSSSSVCSRPAISVPYETIKMATPTTSVKSGDSSSVREKSSCPTDRAMLSENFQFSKIALPIVDDVIQHILAGEQLRMSGRAGQDVQLADAVHHAREQRFIWIHPGTGP